MNTFFCIFDFGVTFLYCH